MHFADLRELLENLLPYSIHGAVFVNADYIQDCKLLP